MQFLAHMRDNLPFQDAPLLIEGMSHSENTESPLFRKREQSSCVWTSNPTPLLHESFKIILQTKRKVK